MCCSCEYEYDRETDLMKIMPTNDNKATFYFGIESETLLYTENKSAININ